MERFTKIGDRIFDNSQCFKYIEKEPTEEKPCFGCKFLKEYKNKNGIEYECTFNNYQLQCDCSGVFVKSYSKKELLINNYIKSPYKVGDKLNVLLNKFPNHKKALCNNFTICEILEVFDLEVKIKIISDIERDKIFIIKKEDIHSKYILDIGISFSLIKEVNLFVFKRPRYENLLSIREILNLVNDNFLTIKSSKTNYTEYFNNKIHNLPMNIGFSVLLIKKILSNEVFNIDIVKYDIPIDGKDKIVISDYNYLDVVMDFIQNKFFIEEQYYYFEFSDIFKREFLEIKCFDVKIHKNINESELLKLFK